MKSLITWVDVTDGHEYHEGDPFPHDGRKVSEKRIKELSSQDNQIGRPVIIVEEATETKEK